MNAVPMATNQGFLNFQCGTKLRPVYLAYWFRVNKPYLELVANGSTYPELESRHSLNGSNQADVSSILTTQVTDKNRFEPERDMAIKLPLRRAHRAHQCS